MSKRTTDLTEEEKDAQVPSNKQIITIDSRAIDEAITRLRRPYGLLAKAGIETDGMRPRDAWNAVNELRKAESAARRREKEEKRAKEKPVKKVKTVLARTSPKAKKTREIAAVPALSASNVNAANNNSHFNRGDNTVKSYEAYAAEINGWDIPVSKKEKLIADLHKRFEEQLSMDARYVPWTVAGPARYPAQKMNALADRRMKASADFVNWFDGIRENVKNSKIQYKDDRKEKARREEEHFNSMMRGVAHPDAAMVGYWLMPIAQYDPKRYAELYEKYDKDYRFRKNTSAAKLYQMVKDGKYTGVKPPKKLYESDSYNAYQKRIQSGERVFIKFTIKPKPQMVYAMKRRGWHWNALEGAWSVPVDKYDAKFVKGIEENYKKYL